MAIDTATVKSPQASAVSAATSQLGKGKVVNPKGALGKDDFLKLLLTELKHQDPTAPVETDKILSQTSQLASLEASQNTNDSLGKLSTALQSSLQFTTVSAIGKIADTGSDEVILKENSMANFELYMPTAISSGTIEVQDTLGNVVQTMNVSEQKKGVNTFSWNGETSEGMRAKEGSYHIRLKYTAANGSTGETKLGVYPISTVRFEEGQTLLKLGSNYVPFKAVKEVYEANN